MMTRWVIWLIHTMSYRKNSLGQGNLREEWYHDLAKMAKSIFIFLFFFLYFLLFSNYYFSFHFHFIYFLINEYAREK